jgi:hypothetical protein
MRLNRVDIKGETAADAAAPNAGRVGWIPLFTAT